MPVSNAAFVKGLIPVVLFLVGQRIPLPGLDLEQFGKYIFSLAPGSAARLAIFALDITPLFTVLAHVEVTRFIFPSLSR